VPESLPILGPSPESDAVTTSLRPLAGNARPLYAVLRGWLDSTENVVPLIVRTSGSGGHPKDVVLSRAALIASATATHERLGGPGQWLLALPPLNVAGLQVMVRSVLAGYEPAFAEDSLTLGEACAAMDGARKYVSLVPTHLHRLARAGELGQLAGFDSVLLGGAAAPADLLAEARAAGVRVVRTYGMSETSGGCVYDGLPLDGVQMRIARDGQVHLSGPTMFDGYSGDPEGTAAVLIDGWFATADLGEIDDEGRLHIHGRMDDVVISGGVNVPLPAVTEALRKCVGVVDAFAVGVEDHEWGQRVVACVVGDATLEGLRDGVTTAGLSRSWAPRQLVTVSTLPLLPGGKVDRLALHAVAEQDQGR